MHKNNHNKRKISLIALALVCCMAVAGVSAYFTDADTATNTFTIGKISIDLQEPEWVPPENITPEQEIPKDPQIKNDGINEEYVFMEVIVPYANIVTANDDGTKNAADDTQLFTWNVNNGWTEISKKTNADSTYTYVYAYTGVNEDGTAKDGSAMEALTKDSTTPALFDAVKFANIVEDQGLEGVSKNIIINAYGIQTTNINDVDTDIDGENNGGATAPLAVWEVISEQAPTTDVDVNENVNTDIKSAN